MRSHFLLVFAFLLSAIVLAFPVQAQTTPPSQKSLAFDTISIRPSGPNAKARGIEIDATMYRAMGMPLATNIGVAFIKPGYLASDLIQGIPAWANSDRYDIMGKFDESTAQAFAKMDRAQRQENIRPLLQTLLTDRCKLVFHRIPVEIPGFALLVAKSGPKMTPAIAGEPAPDGVVPLPNGGMMVPPQPGQPPVLHFFHATMADLIRQIAAGVPISDQTGLTGQFNFALSHGDSSNPASNLIADPYTRAHTYDIKPLGLALKPIKVPADKIVIDSIEKPTPN